MTTPMSKDEERAADQASLKWLMNQVSHLKILTKAEEYALITTFQADPKSPEGKAALDELVRKNLRLVVGKAKKFMGKGIPLLDLVQEGSTGIIRACEKFDISRNFKLSTYSSRWVEQRIRRVIDNKSRVVKVPPDILQEITRLKKKYKWYIEEFGKAPTSEELAELLGITVERAKELGRMLSAHVSLDEPVGEDDNLCMMDYLLDDDFSPEESAESLADKEYLEHLMTFLTKSDSEFLKLKLGFLGDEEKTDRKMSMLLKIPMKEVKEREKRILEELRSHASIDRVNTPIVCRLELVYVPPDYSSVLACITRILNIPTSSGLTLVKNLPSVIISRTNQHLAASVRTELERLGAVVRVIPGADISAEN